MIELAAFDIAGTTVDDGGAVYEALRTCVTELGATVSDANLSHWMGTDKVTAIENLARLGGVTIGRDEALGAFARFQELLAERYRADPPRPIAGVEELISRLRGAGVKVALTTGFDRAVVNPLLASLGWSQGRGDGVVLDAVITTDDVPAGRPAPYMIFRAMEATGVVDVSAVLAAGDTAVDVQAANNAGAISVGVLTGQTPAAVLEGNGADHVLESVVRVATLPGILD
ncbi:phosphonatase-like hydrolase [Gordonia malaquae]|jgi:phosphonatase-like hydrolase|uniref:Putative hydrolase n=1 Tax=Gordonia malaquae NBRC 108250 TaxID=1223542 RepID=M3UGA4_GORML|nr:phosphonatase-like hydrolase [Gordonia malaquae]GAC78275.1 putative hydrolase [Gordonia malaquae NBRC 108250]SED28415.1 phosphonatase-like hydrolase [Gordonia malaquae]